MPTLISLGLLDLDTVAVTDRYVGYQTNNLYRWKLNATADPELGANSGSNFSVTAYDDTGASLLGTPLAINRVSLVTTLAKIELTVPGGPTISSGAGVPVGVEPNASLWLRTDGALGSRLYVSAGAGVWAAVAGV